ncbi:MAG: transposase [Candidatus Binataceae bacterium]
MGVAAGLVPARVQPVWRAVQVGQPDRRSIFASTRLFAALMPAHPADSRRALGPDIETLDHRDRIIDGNRSASQSSCKRAGPWRFGKLAAHFHFTNLTQFEGAAFLRLLLRQLRGAIIQLWDGGPIHRGPAVAQVLARHPRLMVERFPAYAPELNPDEQVWNHCQTQLANGCPLCIDQLLDDLSRLVRRARRSSQLLRSFVLESDLPPFLSP